MALEIDGLDAKIISLLQADGRIPNTAVARQLGVAEATVRKRIERLVREQVIQVGAWADPFKIGYEFYVLIQFQVRRRDIERAAKLLAELPEIVFLGTCTGGFDIFAGAVFQSNDHMYEFMTKRLMRVPGIDRIDTSNLMRIVKRAYSYPTPAPRIELSSDRHRRPAARAARRGGSAASNGRRPDPREAAGP
jgi:Lrp/AsnC family transcriptional regulator for asnA, asnC and gidA